MEATFFYKNIPLLIGCPNSQQPILGRKEFQAKKKKKEYANEIVGFEE
jgi:hypothetical protein